MGPFHFILTSILFLGQILSVSGQQEKLRFERITMEDGLSQSTGNCILKDSKGFMWFGTALGLNRYDGYTMKVFKHVPSDTTSISHNYITCLIEDQDSILWVGTNAGINRFNRKTETFEVVNVPPAGTGINRIISTHEDHSSGDLYFGTDGGGLVYINRETRAVKVLTSSVSADRKKEANTISDFFVVDNQLLLVTLAGIQKIDSTGKFNIAVEYPETLPAFRFVFEDKVHRLWIGSQAGLGYVNGKNLTEIIFPFDELKNTPVFDVEEDEKGNMWVATLGKGLATIDETRKTIRFHRKEISNQYSVSNDALSEIYCDDSGIIWIGGFGGGISKYDPTINKFQNYRDEYSDNLTGILEDKTGSVWFVNASTGVTRYNPSTGEKTNYHQPNSWQYGLCEDDNGDIWTTQPHTGLSKLSQKSGKFELKIKLAAGYSIISGKDGKLYVPVIGKGLASVDPSTHKVEVIDSGKSLTSINFLVRGQNNSIWMGGSKGLVGEYETDTKQLNQYYFTFNNERITDRLISLCEDKKGNLWLAYAGKGLHLADKKTRKTLRVFNEKDGLPNTDLVTLLDDDRGNIWITTNNGLAVFDPVSEKIKSYTRHDGLVDNEFNSFVVFKNNDGKLYFGGMEGFNYFYPKDLIENTHIPPVVLTDFRIFNNSVPVRNSPDSSTYFLKASISETKEIELLHDQNVFSFHFAALNYSLPAKNCYAYKLEGFDKDWIYNGARRSATYTNLAPGRYTFKVKASNNNGLWNEQGTSVKVIIHPPFWKTWWAYMMYVIVSLTILYQIWRYFIHREFLRNQLKLKSIESQKLQEIDGVKTRFYTNVSHEFRTPLTLILGPLETATSLSLASGNTEIKRNLDMVNRNTQRLLELINQLLDFSKLESGNMKLFLEEADVIRFLRTCTMSFSSLAVSKGISLRFETTAESLVTSFDKDKLEKILNNLLSNALKFTREGGSVKVLVDYDDKDMMLQVTDDGIGIPEDKVESIFNRFYQIDNTARTFEGTGLGLALLKELVTLQNGKINVRSSEGKGTLFVLCFPMKAIEIKKATNQGKLTFTAGPTLHPEQGISATLLDDIDSSDNGTIEETANSGKENLIILIVEDNYEIRSYIKSAFGNEFLILEAENGEAGLAAAEKNIPDVVITDIMMPIMDGQELCRLLKTNEKTSHIPVIILTAKASQENKLEGLETGADDYITKPFYLQELQVRVKNLIEQRDKLRKRFTRNVILTPKEVAITSADENFLNKCIAVIEENMSNSDFSVEAFCREIGMSRSQLHRKLTALVAQSTSEFIRNMRLKRAAELIKNNFGNTAEVAYEVGFNNVSYFIKCFKEVYGKTPSEMERNNCFPQPS